MSNVHRCLDPRPQSPKSYFSPRDTRTVSASLRCDLDRFDRLSFSVDINFRKSLRPLGDTDQRWKAATHTINRMGVQLTGISVT